MTDKKTSVLVVENEPIIAMDVRKSLEKLGYEVAGVAASYQEALLKVHENRPDIALMDINIDGNKDGIQTAKALKSHFDIPVIFLTSLKDLEVIQKAKESDPFGYLVKPFRIDDLQTSIEIALSNHVKTQKLKDNLEKFTSAIQVLETAVIILDKDGGVDYFNAKTAELTGWNMARKKGESINQGLILEESPAWIFIESNIADGRRGQAVEFAGNSWIVAEMGERIKIYGHVNAFFNSDGDIAGHLIVFSPGEAPETQVAEPEPEPNNAVIGNYAFLKDKSSLYRIHANQITYVEALGNYVKVHTEGKAFTALIPLKDFEKMLDPEMFFRAHRSYIVAIDKITAIHSTDLQIGNATIPIGKTFRDDLLRRIQVI